MKLLLILLLATTAFGFNIAVYGDSKLAEEFIQCYPGLDARWRIMDRYRWFQNISLSRETTIGPVSFNFYLPYTNILLKDINTTIYVTEAPWEIIDFPIKINHVVQREECETFYLTLLKQWYGEGIEYKVKTTAVESYNIFIFMWLFFNKMLL